MVEDYDSITDQSTFEASQSILQAPPTAVGPEKPNKKRVWIMVGSGIAILLVTLITLGSPKRSGLMPTETSLPSPTPSQSQTSLQQELLKLDREVKATNPDEVMVAPPQVDMGIEF